MASRQRSRIQGWTKPTKSLPERVIEELVSAADTEYNSLKQEIMVSTFNKRLD
jgi:hypothetical protein